MFRRFGKKKTRKEITPINPSVQELINNAMRIQQAHQTNMVGPADTANPQCQTPGNSIISGPSAPADPAQVSSFPSKSSTSAQALPQAGGRSRIHPRSPLGKTKPSIRARRQLSRTWGGESFGRRRPRSGRRHASFRGRRWAFGVG